VFILNAIGGTRGREEIISKEAQQETAINSNIQVAKGGIEMMMTMVITEITKDSKMIVTITEIETMEVAIEVEGNKTMKKWHPTIEILS
jgi:hypothetical protein